MTEAPEARVGSLASKRRRTCAPPVKCSALALSTRVPGVASDAVLLFAVISTILGEWLAPAALRRSLDRAGELHAVDPEEMGRPSDAPESLVGRESHG